jgi:hypothetical protein
MTNLDAAHVIAERVRLAETDPAGEADAVVPVRPVTPADWDREAEAYRAGLADSLERAGYDDPDAYLDEMAAIRSAPSRDAAISQAVAKRADASVAHSIAQGVDAETARRIARQNAELDREEIEANLFDDERENASVNGRFRTGRELVEAAPETVDYVIRPWCAAARSQRSTASRSHRVRQPLCSTPSAPCSTGNRSSASPRSRGPSSC